MSVERTDDTACDPTDPIPVTLNRQGGSYRLYRGGRPYFIKGVCGQRYLDIAAESGANSVRTWGASAAGSLLDHARGYQMTVMLGIWLSHEPSDYLDRTYKIRKTRQVQRLLDDHKNHPSLLMWSLGNEINLQGANTAAAWQFVNELARMIKNQDPNHPVITVIDYDDRALNNIAQHAPDLDAVGINAYGSLAGVRAMIDGSVYDGPYIITEWGVNGHWEVKKTAWGRPIEPTSAQKAGYHLRRYTQHILANNDKCIGSYVFLWGQKQERTPTWYSMFIENLPGVENTGVSCPSVDVMRFHWSGNWPANRAPTVNRMTINDRPAEENVRLATGEAFTARVVAIDPENDGLVYIWELMEEPVILGIGGSHEPRPVGLDDVVKGNLSELHLQAPDKAGEYRLFVYVLDRNGHVGTANIPFRVDETATNLINSENHIWLCRSNEKRFQAGPFLRRRSILGFNRFYFGKPSASEFGKSHRRQSVPQPAPVHKEPAGRVPR